MPTRSHLREKLRKIEALFSGAGTAGERLAAEAALERVRASPQASIVDAPLSESHRADTFRIVVWSVIQLCRQHRGVTARRPSAEAFAAPT